ncbi:MAG: glutamate-1-semialdehyde 2,1-aminomutase [Gammaproteobacteria bacterium]|nr:glutamate-1-semialdehyde 2,1-aminomutase [Gammaproteobacteria bacterium]
MTNNLENKQSKLWFKRALKSLPGGVSSPVRAFHGVDGMPRVLHSASGSETIDEDGNRYLDFVGSWGPLILGHAHPILTQAVREATQRGTSFGAPSRPEIELAEIVAESYPGIEQVRFVSSGTEAVMSAVRLARGSTGRDLIVKFSGCYHGHVDYLLVAAGSGLATFGKPSSDGVPKTFAELTRILPLDDCDAVSTLFQKEGSKIAAVIIEPVPANNGLLLQCPKFLNTLRNLCTTHGALLIFDEVISGFRLGPGGAAEHYGLKPDLATFGKVIGGGMPVGAFGGSQEIMSNLAPQGGVYQAGTLSGNPVAMTAGLTTLHYMKKHKGWGMLEELGQYLDNQLNKVIEQSPVPASLVRIGSIFWIAWGSGTPPRSAETINENATNYYKKVFHGLLEQGVSLAPSAYEVGFLSLAHTHKDIDRLSNTLANVLDNNFLNVKSGNGHAGTNKITGSSL